jgi:hypothetical protein
MSEQSRRRGIGLDVHREFAQVAVWEGGVVTQAGRFATAPDEIRGFAADLGPADEVALEATGNTWAIADMAAEQASILAETTKRGGGRGRQQWDATLKPVGAMQRGSTPSPCVCSSLGGRPRPPPPDATAVLAAVKTSHAPKLSSGRGGGVGVGEGGVFVVARPRVQAVVQDADHAVEQVALGGGVPVAGGLASVVMGAGAG